MGCHLSDLLFAPPLPRSKLERDKDRDISEKIALGLPAGAPSQETLFDQRLFNQSKVREMKSFGGVLGGQAIVIQKSSFVFWELFKRDC